MRRRLFVVGGIILATIATIAANSIVVGRSSANNYRESKGKVLKQDKAGTIDGKLDPNAIPDAVAYSLLFRTLAMREQTDRERKRATAYARSLQMKDGQIEILISIANDFDKQAQALEQKARDIRRTSSQYPNPDDPSMLIINSFRQDKERITANVVSSLPSLLGSEGAAILHQQVITRIKRNMKIFPVGTK